MTTITTSDGIRLDVRTTGSGVPLVFVHEFSGDARSWEPQIGYFSRYFRCTAYCARGYPPSDVPTAGEAYDQVRAAGRYSPMWCAPSPTVRRTSSACRWVALPRYISRFVIASSRGRSSWRVSATAPSRNSSRSMGSRCAWKPIMRRRSVWRHLPASLRKAAMHNACAARTRQAGGVLPVNWPSTRCSAWR